MPTHDGTGSIQPSARGMESHSTMGPTRSQNCSIPAPPWRLRARRCGRPRHEPWRRTTKGRNVIRPGREPGFRPRTSVAGELAHSLFAGGFKSNVV